MPVYGLPLSLEASLNSLVELRPPTSWRVSGHGDEVTVVLRWTLSGSPSSDKTLDYDMDHGARFSVPLDTSSMWARGSKRSEKLSPGTEIKTRSSSVHDCRLTASSQSKYDGLQPFKLRKLDTASQMVRHSPSPVPIYLSLADGTCPSSSSPGQRKPHSLVCETIHTQPSTLVCENIHTQPSTPVCETIHTQSSTPVCDNIHTQLRSLVSDSSHPERQHLVGENAHTPPQPDVCEGASTQPYLLVCQDAHTQQAHSESVSPRNPPQTNCDGQWTSPAETQLAHLIPPNPGPTGDTEICDVVRTFETPCSSNVSPEIASIILDERSGLFSDTQHLIPQDEDGKENVNKTDRPSLVDATQNDSGCASESNSTWLSHYVKHTLSQDSSSPDGSLYKAASTSRSHQASPSSNSRCSSVRSSASRSSLALQSCSSKTKRESLNSSSESTNLMDEKDDDCRSQDLDMVCSNEAEREETHGGSVSSRSSISYWDSFDSLHDDLLAPAADASADIINDCSSQEKSQPSHFTV